MASISGLGSGLDIESIVSQLMSIERRTQDQISQRRGVAQTELTSWNTLKGQLSTLGTELRKFATPGDWNLLKATSSNEAAVGVTATSGSVAGSLTFTVDALARAHAVRSDNTVASLSTQVASGSITLTKSGQSPVSINVGDGSLSSVAAAINGAGQGLTATTVQVGANEYRLQVVSNTTGAASQFTLDLGGGSALGAMGQLTAGQDSTITVGDPLSGGYTITNASNTLTGIVPGLTVQLKAESATAVTVGVTRDVEGFADRMQKMVDAANVVMAQVKSSTAYNADTKQASPLAGDPTARNVAMTLRDAVSSMVGSSGLSAGVFGLQLTKEGSFTFDRAKFIEKFSANPDEVVSTFAQMSSSTDATVRFSSASAGAVAGTYAVHLTQAAEQATENAFVGQLPAAADSTVKFRIGTTEATVSVTTGDTDTVLAEKMNTAFSTAGLSLTATVEGGGIAVRTNAHGAGVTFDVSYDGGGMWTTRTGTDVAGTINGATATGNGQVLSLPTSDATLPGFTLVVTATAAQVTSQGGDFGTVTYAPGVASRMLSAVDDMTDLIDGTVTSAAGAVQRRIDEYTKQISDWDRRLAARESALRLQFANLDTLLGQMKNQSSYLASQIASLSTSS